MMRELQIEDDATAATPTSNIWANKIKGESKQGMSLAYATQKNAKKNLTDDKSTNASKKLCLCAPTSHAGSFRCRLHRTRASRKPSSVSSGDKVKTQQNFDSANMATQCSNVEGQTRLSRFGRAAAAGALHNGQQTTTALAYGTNIQVNLTGNE